MRTGQGAEEAAALPEIPGSLTFPRQGKDFHQTGAPRVQGNRRCPLPPSHTLPPAASEWEFSAGAGSKVTSLLIGLTWLAAPAGHGVERPSPTGTEGGA